MSENSQNSSLNTLPIPSDTQPWPHAIRSQLNRILVQTHFVTAKNQGQLLRFLVEEYLEDRIDEINEAAIARAVFGPLAADDPNLISGLQAVFNDLRDALNDYYNFNGRNDPVLFILPIGKMTINVLAMDVEIDQEDINRDALPEGIPDKRYSVNYYAAAALLLTFLATGIYLVGLKSATDIPNGPESITDVGPPQQKLYSLVVLPFTYKSQPAQHDFYAKAVSGELISRLGLIHQLRVIAPKSIFNLDNTQKDKIKIAETLAVRYILTGDIANSNNQIKLNLKLTETESEEIKWKHQYELKNTSYNSYYAKIGDAITEILFGGQQKNQEKPKRKLKSDQIEINHDTYSTYLRAQYESRRETAKKLAYAITLFRSVIKSDPQLLHAHAGLATSLTQLAGNGFEQISPKLSIPDAKKAVISALRLDEYAPEPYAVLGKIHTAYDWDWKGAERAFVYAIRYNPSYASARVEYSRFLGATGRHQEAIKQAERAHLLDPLSRDTYVNRVWQYLQANWLVRAEQHLKILQTKYPTFWGSQWLWGHYYWRRENNDDALKAFLKAVEMSNDNVIALASLGHMYALQNQKTKAINVLGQIQKISKTRYVSPVFAAKIHAGLGNKEKSLKLLEKAHRIKAYGLAWLNVTKEFVPFHNDPRFLSLLKRIGLNTNKTKKS